MAIKIGLLQVDLRLLSARFNDGLKSAGSSLTRFSSNARRASGSLTRLSAGLTATAGLGGAGLLIATRQAALLADQIGKAADAVGLSTDAYQELVFVADKAGIAQSQLNSNLTAFVKRVGEARAGTGPLVSFLNKYDQALLTNIQNTSNQDQALQLVIQAIDRAATATDRAAIANAAFSRAGVTMVNTVRNGVEQFNALREQAQALGLVMEERLIRNAEAANDQLSILSDVIRVRLSTALLELAPQIDAIATAFIEALPAATRFVSQVLNIQTPVQELSAELDELREKRDLLLTQRQQRTGGLRGLASSILGLPDRAELEGQINEINELILQKAKERDALLAQQREANRTTIPPPPELDTARLAKIEEQRQAELERDRQQLANKLQTLQESLLSEEEALRLHFERRVAIVDQAFADGVIPTEQRWREINLQLEERYQDDLARIQNKGCTQRAQFELSCQQQRARNLFRELASITSGVSQHNKALFRINQVAAIANATINTFEGVSRTLATYPWPIAGALAAIHLAAGLAQVSAISSASFGGSRPSPSAVGGGAVTGTVPTIPADQFSGQPATAATTREVNVTIQGTGFSRQDVRDLIEQINEEIGDGVTLAVAS